MGERCMEEMPFLTISEDKCVCSVLGGVWVGDAELNKMSCVSSKDSDQYSHCISSVDPTIHFNYVTPLGFLF